MGLVLFVLWLSVEPGFEGVPDEDDVALRETAEHLLSHPVELNRATVDDLIAIPWLNALLAFRIVRFRDSVGGFSSTDQLLSVPGMSDEVYAVLVPVTTVAKPSEAWHGSVLVRSRSDSMPLTGTGASVLARAEVERPGWQACCTVEKDAGETEWTDWVGLGLAFQGRGLRVAAGDYTLGSGLGLCFSGPHRSGGARWGVGAQGPDRARLARSALENRALRGVACDLVHGPWGVTVAGSYAGRDAQLNPDGTVVQLRGSGVHDDSAALAERDQVSELVLGTTVARHWPGAAVEAGAVHVRYSRDFAPEDSGSSFAGRSITVGTAGADIRTGDYRVAVEGAVSSGGGVAGAMELAGDWQGLAAGFGVSGHGQRFFAPLGRWRRLTNQNSRLFARGRVGYRQAGFKCGIRGNTYRDFEADSLPARLTLEVGQQVGRFAVELGLGRSYRLEQQRARSVRLDAGLDLAEKSRAGIVVEDEYPEDGSGRGRMAAVVLRLAAGQFWAGLTGARFDIAGSGIRMYVSEYGPMRTGSGFGTSESAWRVSLGTGWRFGSQSGIGVRVACSWRAEPVLELGGQLELGLN